MKTNKLQQLMDGTQEALAKANASEYFQKLLKTVSRQFIIYADEHDIDSFSSLFLSFKWIRREERRHLNH